MAITKITTPELFNLQSNNTEGTRLPVMTTTQRNAMTGMSNGELIFNSATDSVEYYDLDATAWYKIDYNSEPFNVDYLVVAGGGGAAWGGGGGGGYRTSYGTGNINGGLTPVGTALTLEVAISYTVTVGTAGARGSGRYDVGGTGGSSIFSSITSLGGLGGKSNSQAGDGGAAAGAGTYGFRGGINQGNAGSGGGGAAYSGTDTVGAPFYGTNGGVGLRNDITVSVAGTGPFYAGGGGGGNRQGYTTGSGGNGGGGNASLYFSSVPLSGVDNTGGGGGGTTYNNAVSWNTPGLGGTGVVILRYPAGFTASSTLAHTDAVISGSTDRIITITGTGTGTVTFA